MKDLVTKGTGNSRYMKSAIGASETWEQAREKLRNGTFPFDLNGLNEAGIEQMGMALSKQNLLADNTAAALGLSGDPTVDDAFGALENSVQLTYTVVPDKEMAHEFWYDTAGTNGPDITAGTPQRSFLIQSGEWFLFSAENQIYQTKDPINGPWDTITVKPGTYNSKYMNMIGRDGYVLVFYKVSNVGRPQVYNPESKSFSNPAGNLPSTSTSSAGGHRAASDGTLFFKDTSGGSSKTIYVLPTDSNNWQTLTTTTNSYNVEMEYNNGVYVFFYGNGYVQRVTSLNPFTYTSKNTDINNVNQIIVFNNNFVACNGSTNYVYSIDGTNWSEIKEYPGGTMCVFGDVLVSIRTDTGVYSYTTDLENWYDAYGPKESMGAPYLAYYDYSNNRGVIINTSGGLPIITEDTTKNVYQLQNTQSQNINDAVSQAIGVSKIVTGSYTGTGTSGRNNPNTLTFPDTFTPKIVFIISSNISYLASPYCWGADRFGVYYIGSTTYSSSYSNLVTVSGNVMSWYFSNFSDGSEYQLNAQGKTYNYIAIG